MPEPEPRYRYWGNREPQANFHGIRAQASTNDHTAEMRLYDPIDSWGEPFGISAKDFATALDALPDDTTTITLRINSPGGEVGDSLAILNSLRNHKASVNVIVEGRACSGASVVAMAGDTVTMARQSQMMIHDASGIGIGNASEMQDYAAFLDKSSDNIATAYAERAGGTPDEWRAVMKAETWFNADEAVAAKLADAVQQKTAVATASLNRFDLSIFNYAGREQAPEPHTPADQPVTPPTDHKEADTMSDTIPKAGLVKALGLPDDADEDSILEAVEAKVTASAADPEITPDAIAKAYGVTAEQAKSALEAAKAGKETVSASYLATLEANAKLGAEARAKQLADERDEAIQAKVAAGIISRDQVESWQRDWDRDPTSAKAELDKLTVARFPIGDAPGHGGDADVTADYTDEKAAEDAELFGLPKEAFAR